MGIKLDHSGERIVQRGGDKRFEKLDELEADNTLLIMELMKRAPNQSLEDYQEAFVALRMEYGMDALGAIRTGHVKFELVTPRDRKDDPPAGDR